MKQVIIGMSGGVDSSVAAFLLKEQGWDVTGVFMKNWEDEHSDTYRHEHTSGCIWEKDFEDVRRVCDQLEIPYQTFNFTREYRELVFSLFLKELEQGRTPNPDIACNQEIKFNLFAKKALALEGIDAIATGHYARINEGALCRPKDDNKDQTYFLYRVPPDILNSVIFPLEDLTKDEVRTIAKKQNFPNADKKDSTGICFIGDIDYNAFIKEYIPENPGLIVSTGGKTLGEHKGLHFFTIGQRRGIDIGGTGPYYVVEKRIDTDELVVTNDKDDARLYQRSCIVEDLHHLTNEPFPEQCQVQVRYRQKAVDSVVTQIDEKKIEITFDQPVRAITPGQSAVLYDNDCVIGGGVISQVDKTE
ncbi:MAG: tRNA 2-thiouridine(34) synthase MnmA [Candidatus Kerfeldbacteria bacterium]